MSDDGAKSLAVRRGLYLVILGSLVFFASWWNRYVPPTSGGEAVLMARWGHDFLPYRDYFLQAPPGVPILVQIISMVGGPHLLGTLTFGALLRIGGACALYGMLVTIARPPYAAVATLTALFVSSTDISDTPFYYNHIGAAMVLIGTYLGLRGAQGNRPKHYLALGASGALLMYAVTVKQTMIFGAAASVVALVVLLLPRPPAGWVRWLASLTAGALVVLGGMWAWLAAHDLVGSFLFVFRRAPEGKGGIARSLLRPVTLLFEVQLREALEASVAAWLVIAIIATIWVLHRRGAHFRRDVVLLLILLAGGWSIYAGFWWARFTTLFLTALGWWGSLVLVALHLRSLRAGTIDPVGRAHVALGVLSFGIGYCFAVSWPLFENIAFPGLAVVVAAILERPPSNARTRWVASVLVLALASMYLAVDRKFESPHSWGLWYEPPLYEPRGRFVHPVLAGMRTSEISSELYAAVAQVARERTKPDDRMYVFPNMPILYALAERRPATYSLAHWVDICPDFLGEEDAARLKANPPKMMIIRDDPLAFVANEERLYRGGRRSSVRDIVGAFTELAPMYDRVGVFTSHAAAPIFFLIRRDPPGR